MFRYVPCSGFYRRPVFHTLRASSPNAIGGVARSHARKALERRPEYNIQNGELARGLILLRPRLDGRVRTNFYLCNMRFTRNPADSVTGSKDWSTICRSKTRMVPQVRVNESRILELLQVDLVLIPSEKKASFIEVAPATERATKPQPGKKLKDF